MVISKIQVSDPGPSWPSCLGLVKNIMGKRENASYQHFRIGKKHYGKRRECWLPAFSPFPMFLAPLAVGQRAYVMVRHPSVRASVRPCVNFFFKHLLH